jgi:hypothetical protein
MLLTFSYQESASAEQFVVNEDETRTIKVYHPMPYHGNDEQNLSVSKVYKEGDKFYHIVEQSYQNDTFFIKIQDNINARDRFFALGDAVKDLNIDKENSPTKQHKSNISLEDLTKVFPPSTQPQLERGAHEWSYAPNMARINFEYSSNLSSVTLSVPTPPPNFA